jgi:tRNA threonylcarbamoyladenosine biosynthesis protein TsaE
MITRSKAQTQKIAIRLAKSIIANCSDRSVGATVIALIGDLGSGKTAFTGGFIKSLGIKTHVPSPTFVIFRRYPIHKEAGGFKNVFHFDLYRIQKPKEIIDLDFKKIIKNPENIVLIEWPEQIMKFLPKNTIKIFFSHSKKEKERTIEIKN